MRTLALVVANEASEAFKPLTGGAKAMASLGGRRLFQYIAEELRQVFGDVYVASPEPLEGYNWVEAGPSESALAKALELAPTAERALVADGSVITEAGAIRALVEAAASSGAEGAVLAVPSRARGLAISMGAEGLLAGLGGESQLIYGGLALLPAKALRAAEGLSIAPLLAKAAEASKIAVAVWSGRWHRVEEPVDLLTALEHVMPDATYISPRAKISPTAVIEGPVKIEEGAEVDHYAVVKGPAYIGRGAFVGAHALVRNFADIEAEAVVGSSAEVSHSLIGARATVGRGAFVSYSVVGEEAVVEPGVLTMSVLRVGRERLRPIEVRGREFYKLGALIPARARVKAGSTLEPGQGF
ncbi:MAG: NTP transferase domain-containing protein [Thermoproteus sp. AZ2]|jgi:glucose-1-phosphate thymidylyltransferase|uniref:NTP transferase domain-containing protein n=1 Tax=Thermoproteus sp. AZ2 TaxID=1609232 RepID=A0ACC6V0L0_9CREN